MIKPMIFSGFLISVSISRKSLDNKTRAAFTSHKLVQQLVSQRENSMGCREKRGTISCTWCRLTKLRRHRKFGWHCLNQVDAVLPVRVLQVSLASASASEIRSREIRDDLNHSLFRALFMRIGLLVWTNRGASIGLVQKEQPTLAADAICYARPT